MLLRPIPILSCHIRSFTLPYYLALYHDLFIYSLVLGSSVLCLVKSIAVTFLVHVFSFIDRISSGLSTCGLDC